MALEDLDLEFEDEEEQEALRRKNDPLQPAVPLEFALQDERPKLRLADDPNATQVLHMPSIINGRAQPAEAVPQGRAPIAAPAQAAPAAAPSASQELIELREKARIAEFNAEVKIQVADHKIAFMTEMLSDVKLMDHQINQLLLRIHSKHPDMKQEVLMIKKILADFTAKKRK